MFRKKGNFTTLDIQYIRPTAYGNYVERAPARIKRQIVLSKFKNRSLYFSKVCESTLTLGCLIVLFTNFWLFNSFVLWDGIY